MGLDENRLDGGCSSQAVVRMDTPAPDEGLVVQLFSSSTAVKLPENVVIPAGKSFAIFPISTQPVYDRQTVDIRARTAEVEILRQLTVLRPRLVSFAPEVDHYFAGEIGRALVTLSSPAPENGLTINVRSSSPLIDVVAISVPAGETDVWVPFRCHAFTSEAAVDLTATFAGVTFSSPVTITTKNRPKHCFTRARHMTGQSAGGFLPVDPNEVEATYRTRHYAVEACESVRITWANYIQFNGAVGEEKLGNAYRLEASVEYGGMSVPITFRGQASTLVEDGQRAVSDPIPQSFPAGAEIFIRQHVSVASPGMHWPSSITFAPQEGVAHNRNLVAGTGFTGFLRSGFSFGPAAITGFIVHQQKPVIWLDGDSIFNGGQDAINDYGLGKRALNLSSGDLVVSEYNYGIGARAGATFKTSNEEMYEHRRHLAMAADIVLCNLGVNSIVTNEEAMRRSALQHWKQWANTGIPVVQLSILPLTTSDDGWSTARGQTPSGLEGRRIAFNQWCRDTSENGAVAKAAEHGVWLVFLDISGEVEVNGENEPVPNGGRWRMFGDGPTYNCIAGVDTSIRIDTVLPTNQWRYCVARVNYASGPLAGTSAICALSATTGDLLNVSTLGGNRPLPQAPTVGDTVTIVQTAVSPSDGAGIHPNSLGLTLLADRIYHSGIFDLASDRWKW
jgi:hypothetical protein